jgi:hypothetical protein
MGIVNRSLDESQQQEVLHLNVTNQINTQEQVVAIVPCAMSIQEIRTSCLGISGAPTGLLRVSRFGGATFNVGLTFLIPSYGVSGAMAALSLPATGDTRLNLQKDDCVSVIFGGGTGSASNSACVELVVKNLQDIKTWY